MKRNVLIGITSGIAAFKVLELIRFLKNEEIEVNVIATENSLHMLPVSEIEELIGKKIHTKLFTKNFNYKEILKERKVEHIELADSADVAIVLPATANFVGKIAAGIADDLLTTTTLALTCPTIICPSMNVHMWHNPAVQRNIKQLKEFGYSIVEPEAGMLACGYTGKGRLPKIIDIKDEILKQLARTQQLRGKKILVTAGATVEPIDSIRFITNKSTGKMGIALAEECFLRGADILLARSKYSIEPSYHMPQVMFETTEQLEEILLEHIPTVDILFHTAAVSDFKVKEYQTGKISSDVNVSLTLTKREKLIDRVKKINPNIFLVGFKAEYDLSDIELKKEAFKKLKKANADAIVANDIKPERQGFEADTNEVVIVTKNKSQKFSLASKKIIAKQIVDFLL